MGFGGEDTDTDHRLAQHGEISDQEIVDALVAVMRQDAFNHRDLQAVDGRMANGMSNTYRARTPVVTRCTAPRRQVIRTRIRG